MKPRTIVLLGFVALVAAPFAGGLIRGLPPEFFLFPPLVHEPPDVPPFAGPVFSFFALLSIVAFVVLAWPGILFRGAPPGSHPPPRSPRSFPWWGWAGALLALGTWGLLLSPVPPPWWVKDHTFFPLWLGYILTIDGLRYARTGSSILTRTPATFFMLFPASAVTWWYFEFLNRFVQNWWYEMAIVFGPVRYVVHATVCFSTVLPAIFETSSLIRTLPFLERYQAGPIASRPGRRGAWILICLGMVGLVAVTLAPKPLFALIWVAPIPVLVGVLELAGQARPLGRIDEGDYRQVVSLAIGAVVCGIFWEMWNWPSLPKWHYSVPYVSGFKIFEMPIVGYSGYVPFGPLCWCFWLACRVLFEGRNHSPSSSAHTTAVLS